MKKTNRKTKPVKEKKPAKKSEPKKPSNTGYFLVPFLLTAVSLIVESCLVFNEKTGFVGKWVYNIFTGLFGGAAYFIPAGVLTIAFFYNSICENKVRLFKSGMLTVFAAFLSALNSIFALDNLRELPVNIPDFFVRGYSGEGGGVIGGLVGKLMYAAFGSVFSVIFSVVICILALTFFLGTTKVGIWFYLREMRMFGAEKTITPKMPKKAPEKISSKETAREGQARSHASSQSAQNGIQYDGPQNIGMQNLEKKQGEPISFGEIESVPVSYDSTPISDPFLYGSAIGRKKKPAAAIDLRAPETKKPETVDIYSEETPEEKKPVDIKITEPRIQYTPQSGSSRAYSPFADPFTKREDFMKNGTRSEPGRAESYSAPSRAFSPFADPFQKREDFIRQNGGGARIDEGARSAASNMQNRYSAEGGYGEQGVNGQGQYGGQSYSQGGQYSSQLTPPETHYNATQNAAAQSGLASSPAAQSSFASNSVNQAPQNGFASSPVTSASQNGFASSPTTSASQNGFSANSAAAAAQGGFVSSPVRSSAALGTTGQSAYKSGAGDSQNPYSAGAVNTASQISYTPPSFEDFAKKEQKTEPEREGSGITAESVVPEKSAEQRTRENTAPWDTMVKAAASVTSPKLSLSEEDYSEDVEDEEEREEGGYVKADSLPRFDFSAFSPSSDKYKSDAVPSEQEAVVIYRDHTEKLYPNYVYPSSVLLEQRPVETTVTEEDVIEIRNKLLGKLASFRIEASLVGYSAGPTITRYEIAPGPGVKVKAITNLIEDIGLELQSDGVRIATVPGKSVIGIEVPNKVVSVVSLRSLLENRDFMTAKSKITVCVGLTVTGKPVYMDIDDMPHVLIAGQTKSGKSVAINCMLLSLLYRTTPDEVQLILIDPKRVELNIYSKVPHLAMPVIDDPQRAAAALRWAVGEMERRYEMMDELGVRNRDEYYELKEQDPTLEYLPQIVIVIDELADLMLQVREHVETLINRIAAKARACGIHLVVGTQRPSVDIVTGLIKANIPARISFQVSSSADSRIILGAVGAEKLLGRGDMLYQATGAGRVRVQGAFVSSSEIKRVTKFIIDNNGEAQYDPEVMRQLDIETDKINKSNKKAAPSGETDSGGTIDGSEVDYDYVCKAMELIFENRAVSTNVIQRHLHIGFNRAADIVDALEGLGFISPRNGSKPRDILIDYESFEQWKLRNAE